MSSTAVQQQMCLFTQDINYLRKRRAEESLPYSPDVPVTSGCSPPCVVDVFAGKHVSVARRSSTRAATLQLRSDLGVKGWLLIVNIR